MHYSVVSGQFDIFHDDDDVMLAREINDSAVNVTQSCNGNVMSNLSHT